MSKFDAAEEIQSNYTKHIDNSFDIKVEMQNSRANANVEVLEAIEVSKLYAAPAKWQRLSKNSDEDTAKMVDSILMTDLQAPVVLWKVPYEQVAHHYEDGEEEEYGFKGKEYMILTGHNRSNSYKILFDETKDEKYKRIPSRVNTNLTETQARNIIIDANAVQRALSTSQKNQLINAKYELWEDIAKEFGGKINIANNVAEELNLSPKTVFIHRRTKEFYEPLKVLILESNKIDVEVAKYLEHLSEKRQQWLYENYKDYLTTANIKKIKPYMTDTQIQTLFNKIIQSVEEGKDKTMGTLKVKMPKEWIEEAEAHMEIWLKKKREKERKVVM